MKRIVIAAVALLLSAAPALALGPFEDARQNIASGDVDSALLGIAMGALSVNQQDEQGYTLLHYAAQQGSLPAVKALLDRGADPSIKARDDKTPLALAADPAVRAVLEAAVAKQAGAPH